MQANVRQMQGNWQHGFSLDRQTLWSHYLGLNEHGYDHWETRRPPVGEAMYQLKYKGDWTQVQVLAEAIVEHICPLIPIPAAIIPMAASTARQIQPVTAVAQALGQLVQIPVCTNVLFKVPGGPRLKDLKTREEKDQALAGRFYVVDNLPWNDARHVLLLDDLYDSGASAEAATAKLLENPKVSGVTLVTLTRKSKV